MHPHWGQDWPFPLKCWRCLLQKDIASFRCSSLLLQKEISWDHTAFTSPETTAWPEQRFKAYGDPLIGERSEPFVLSSAFHPQCGVGHHEVGPCFLSTLMQWARRKLSPLLLRSFDSFQRLVSEKMKYHKQMPSDVFSWNSFKIQGVLEKSPF